MNFQPFSTDSNSVTNQTGTHSEVKSYLRHDHSSLPQRAPEVLSPGEWLRRMGELDAPFGFDRMPTVLG